MHIYYVISLESVVKPPTVKLLTVKWQAFPEVFTGNCCFSEIQATCPLNDTCTARMISSYGNACMKWLSVLAPNYSMLNLLDVFKNYIPEGLFSPIFLSHSKWTHRRTECPSDVNFHHGGIKNSLRVLIKGDRIWKASIFGASTSYL